jgi:hypothetical protein
MAAATPMIIGRRQQGITRDWNKIGRENPSSRYSNNQVKSQSDFTWLDLVEIECD